MTTPDEDSKIQAIAERLRFFFSDANVRQDGFMRKPLLDENSDHPNMLTVEALLRFHSIQQHSKEAKDIVAAAKTVDTLVVSDDEKAIGRVQAFSLQQMDDNIPLTLVVQNLPVEDGKYTVQSEHLRELFQEYGEVALVKFQFERQSSSRKKRTPEGVALVEFAEQSSYDKAVVDTLTIKEGATVEPKKALKLKENDLKVQSLREYLDERKKRKSLDGDKGDGGDDDDKVFEPFKMDWKPGCVIQLAGLAEHCSRESLLDAVAKALEITVDEVKERNVYVDYSRGDTEGAIRFAEPTDDVAKVCEKLKSGELEVAGAKVGAAALLTGDLETTYWNKFIEFKNKQKRRHYEQRGKKRSRKSY